MAVSASVWGKPMPLGLGTYLQLDRDSPASAAAPTFDPTVIGTGCVWWVQPDLSYMEIADVGDPGPPTIDGDAVGRWIDASGVGNDVIQSTAANRPLYYSNIQNGLPMLLFDGSNDHLVNHAMAAYFTGDDTPVTVGVVFKLANTLAGRVLIGVGNSGAANPYGQYCQLNPTTYQPVKRDDAAATAFPVGGTTDTNCHLMIVRNNGTTVDMWVDNTQIISASAFNVGVQTLDRFAVGSRMISGAIGQVMMGYIGEGVIWNNALSNADITTARTQWLTKWAL